MFPPVLRKEDVLKINFAKPTNQNQYKKTRFKQADAKERKFTSLKENLCKFHTCIA